MRDSCVVRPLRQGRKNGSERWAEEIREMIQEKMETRGHLLQSRLGMQEDQLCCGAPCKEAEEKRKEDITELS